MSSVNLHLPLDVVLQEALVHRVKVAAAHVVVVVGHRVAELLPVGSILHVVGLVAVVVVVVAWGGQRESVRWGGSQQALFRKVEVSFMVE